MNNKAFTTLTNFLTKIPAIIGEINIGSEENGQWWVKFEVDINHKTAWHTIQELGHVLNYLSTHERLPTRFFPISPPPYMNGGPEKYLSWIIECHDPKFRPGTCAKWLESRLPNPITDLNQWLNK